MTSSRYYIKTIMGEYKFTFDKQTYIKSSPLIPNRGFIVGMGSVFNLGGNYFDYNYSRSPEAADFKAIKRDWELVGHDLSQAFSKIGQR